MTKTKILAAVLASLACVALLGSCDYWKEDYYKNGGDSGSVASGGSGSGSTASVPTYSGNLTVNGASYTTLAMDGTSTSGTATLSGSAGSLSGTYARAVATAAAASEFTGSYTITFSSGTITVTFNGNSITLTNGSITASGTGTLVVQASGGSTGGSSGSGYNYVDERPMTAQEKAVYNSLLGTRWRSGYVPIADRASSYESTFRSWEVIINADGSGEHKVITEDKYGNILRVVGCDHSDRPSFHGSWVKFDTDDSDWWFVMDYSTGNGIADSVGIPLTDRDGDGVIDHMSDMIKVN
ncbi:MAG: hypothetical protein ILP18_05310 [Treponema sp.]|nr:hypothetical protein [Treponema sp.]